MSYTIRSEAVMNVSPKKFREGGRPHRKVRLFLAADGDDSLEDVTRVEYELHPTFRHRHRVVEDPQGGFELMIWTYGYFPVRGRVHRAEGPPVECKGYVRW